MKKLFIIFAALIFLTACSTGKKLIDTKLYQEQFPGFVFGTQSNTSFPLLSGYEYQTIEGKKLVITGCEQASHIDISTIADYDYFRFKLLLVSCIAVEKYSTVSAAHVNNFPSKLDENFIYQLPAAIIPLLSRSESSQRKGLSIKSYDASIQVTVEKENTFKLLTKEDEVYLTLLARGDFTNDGFEDLLIQSEWYARKAHGKHVDLLILSRTDGGGVISISWRLNKLN